MNRLPSRRRSLTLLLGLMGGCLRPASADHGKPPKESKKIMEERIVKNLREADVVLVGSPTGLESSPGIWSGLLATYQGVHYRVERYIKGAGAAPVYSIVILHPLVSGAPTADLREPKLRAEVFAPGRRLVVFARVQDHKLYCIDERSGVIPADEETVRALEALVEVKDSKR